MTKHRTKNIIWNENKIRQLEGLMKLDPKRADVAHILGVSNHALSRFIEKKYSMNFTELKILHMAGVKSKLVKIALEQAFSGLNNTMLIFCLKNVCQWTDKHQISGDARAPIVLKYKIEEL